MSKVNVSDLKLHYLVVASRAANGDEKAQMALDIFHSVMEEEISEAHARVLRDAWRLAGIKVTHALYQAFLKQNDIREEAL